MKSFYLISLGCPKNLVDSEGMATLLRRAGYNSAPVPADADLLIVNTCGFIESARQESLAVLSELAQAKEPHQQLIAAGCYSQRYPRQLAQEVPGIDGLIGTRRWMDIVKLVEQLDRGQRQPRQPVYHVPRPPTVGQDTQGVARAAVQGTSAYLKLSDGCRRSCAFCAIPLIKGPALSRPLKAILSDARRLAEWSAQEIILIAQDTTDYGRDLGMKEGLASLLEALVVEVPDVPWIRLMYAYPGRITPRLIAAMARHSQILPYIDLPLQHAHQDTLRRMGRPANVQPVKSTIASLRQEMPEIAIRTTFLVGYPGETEEAFEELLDFVAEMRFDRVGTFTYSHEPGTRAAELEDDVAQEVKERRRQRLMALQQPISLEKNQALVGKTLDVLIEGCDEGISVGRSYRDAPEIDGFVLIHQELPLGEIVPVPITAAMEYDLVAEGPREPGSSYNPSA